MKNDKSEVVAIRLTENIPLLFVQNMAKQGKSVSIKAPNVASKFVNDAIDTASNALESTNPSQIETIRVLKRAQYTNIPGENSSHSKSDLNGNTEFGASYQNCR